MIFSASPLHDHPSPNLGDFYAWLDDQGVSRHDGLQVKHADDSGWGVHSTKDIDRGDVLCAVPRDLILSAKTASLQTDQEAEDYAGLVLQLTACLLHELRLGSESRWYPWLQVLPRDIVQIPTLWGHAELGGEDGQRGLDWLVRTEAARELETKEKDGLSLQDLSTYHASLDVPPTGSHPSPPSLASFLYAYSLVSSRGFVIDAYHTIGLIPFCDMFNHSSTTPHTSLTVDAGVCEICGSLLPCPHDNTQTPDRLAHLPPTYLAQLEKDGLADKVDMRAQRLIREGEQVLSCYDEDKRNASLLVEYGFIDDDRNSTVTWGYREVLTPPTLPLFVGVVQGLELEQAVEGEGERYGLIGEVKEDQPEPLQHTPQTEPEQLRNDIRGAIEEVREAALLSCSPKQLSPTTSETGKSVVKLLQSRLRGLRAADTPLTELQSVLEALSPESSLERLGLQAMLSERKLVERSLRFWAACPTEATT